MSRREKNAAVMHPDRMKSQAMSEKANRMGSQAHVPVTVLTGFLGSGKTTLLNRILREQHGYRIAIVENEYGETSIDSGLIERSQERIIELNNGCICCPAQGQSVRWDIVSILSELMERRDVGEITFDRVVIETSGLALPGPLVQTFLTHDEILTRFSIDAVLTVVDAKHANVQLNEFQEVQEQVGFADRILLAKLDLVGSTTKTALQERLRAINPHAPILDLDYGSISLDRLFDVEGFGTRTDPDLTPHECGHDHHHHTDGISSFVFTTLSAFKPERFERAIYLIVSESGDDLLRYKGIVNLEGHDNRFILQGVMRLVSVEESTSWSDNVRCNTIVFIGRRLVRESIVSNLNYALAGSPEATKAEWHEATAHNR
jgi:G3E family GTPase